MSGGFFRGTSAEQDTRFSNKQAKLLKSQKFPPELDHLVDIAKVKMDIMKPWIAKRVTELLGFEDEVLINFINGLLEGKNINGKQIQIQLTGFMEKHTGKFMKELWSLLLSAQNNASGVPQQFLDAKEEETRRKKEELDRIGNEMQKRKEKESRESEHISSKMGGVIDYSHVDLNTKYAPPKDSKVYSDDEKEGGNKNGFRRSSRASRSPKSADRRPSPHCVASRAASKSYSNSRSYSEERNRSRNLSRSPLSRRHSISPDRRNRFAQRSVSPIRRHTSDESLSPRKRSPSKRLSTSHSPNRSVSPQRRRVRSPVHRRSPFPGRRRSRSPLQRRSRSPRRRRSPSPWRQRRSPSPRRRRRSPSPWRRRSRRRSPSPWRRRSPSPRRHLSPSPVRRHSRRSPSSSPSPVRRRPSSPSRNRPPPRSGRRSPSPSRRRPLSPLKQRSPSPSRARSLSSVSASPSVKTRVPGSANLRLRNQQHRSSSPKSQLSSSPVRRISSSPSGGNLTNPKKDILQSPRDRSRNHNESSPTILDTRKERYVIPNVAHIGSDTTRSMSSKSPHLKDQTITDDRDDKAYKRKLPQRPVSSPRHKNTDTLDKSSIEHRHDDINLRKKEKDIRREKMLTKENMGLRNSTDDISSPVEKPVILSPIDERREGEDSLNLMKKDNLNSPTVDSTGSEGKGMHRTIVTKKRKHRKSSRHDIGSASSDDDSEVKDRKEAKRRRKEEKKLRKDEKRRRREERRFRKEEKRAHKRRSKDSDTMSSNSDKHENDVNSSDGDHIAGKKTYSSNKESTESEKKRLENELREKALQNIRAKKGMSR